MAYDVLREETPNRASREYLQILELAARESGDMVDSAPSSPIGGGAGNHSAGPVKEMG